MVLAMPPADLPPFTAGAPGRAKAIFNHPVGPWTLASESGDHGLTLEPTWQRSIVLAPHRLYTIHLACYLAPREQQLDAAGNRPPSGRHRPYGAGVLRWVVTQDRPRGVATRRSRFGVIARTPGYTAGWQYVFVNETTSYRTGVGGGHLSLQWNKPPGSQRYRLESARLLVVTSVVLPDESFWTTVPSHRGDAQLDAGLSSQRRQGSVP